MFKAHAVPQGLCACLVNALKLLAKQQEDGDGLLQNIVTNLGKVDANCNIDDSNDQRGVLVQELCAVHNLLPLFQRFWTLAWQSPTGSMWKKKVDSFSNQCSAKVEIAEKLHSRSDHKPLRLSRPHVPGVMLEFERTKKSLAGCLSKHVSLGASVGEIQQAFETVMGDVSREWECSACGPLNGDLMTLDPD